MPSPIEQSKRQYQILRNILNDNAKNLLNKFMFLQKKFGCASFNPIVSIADKTILKHPEKRNEDILKSDHVSERITNIIKENKKNNRPTSLLMAKEKDLVFKFKKEEVERIVDFIKDNDINKEISKVSTIVKKQPIFTKIKTNDCEHNNQIHYGKFGYYFKCSTCEQNTKIKEICNCCQSKKTKIRKSKNEFFIVCKDCHKEYSYFKNDK